MGYLYTYYSDGTTESWVEFGPTQLFGVQGPRLYIQDTEPDDPGNWFWIQTGLGTDGLGTQFHVHFQT